MLFEKRFGKNLAKDELDFVRYNNNYSETRNSSYISRLFKEKKHEQAIFYFIKDNAGILVGYICATGSMMSNNKFATRIDIYVLPQFRGQNIGKISLRDWLKQYGNGFVPIIVNCGTKDRLWFYYTVLKNSSIRFDKTNDFIIIR